MIIFTVTNQVSGQVYVGSTRNDLASQWEKMVVAAEQNMDYPLYCDIRSQGAEHFHVEEWDFTDDRNELAILEQEALDTLRAKSLKGYKTSTVKIQPKKKVRPRKSAIEKELVSLFEELASATPSEDIPAPETSPSSSDKGTSNNQSPSVAAKPAKSPTAKSMDAKSVAEAASALLAEKSQANVEASKPPQPVGGSQANAVVNMQGINLNDDITAQLAAIQAAADAAIAGDSPAAAALNTVTIEPPCDTPAENSLSVKAPEATVSDHPTIEVTVELDPKTQSIQEAVARARQEKLIKTAEQREEERQHLASLLSELETRAAALRTGALAVAA